MGSLSDVYENNALDALLGPGFTRPATVYVALYTAMPTDAGGGTEVAGNGYARVAVPNDSTNWPVAISGQKKNGTAIVFPQATGSWGTIVGFGLFDAATAGIMICWGALGTSKPVAAGETPQFAANAIMITAD